MPPLQTPAQAHHAASHSALILTAVAIVAISGLVLSKDPGLSGAITLQDQAVYDIATASFNRCDPDTNPFIESPIQRINCCTGQCFTPCVQSGISNCLTVCKTVCQGTPMYSSGGTP